MSREIVLRVFSDYVCPWCYLNACHLERLLADDPAVSLRFLAFPLNQSTPEEGMSLKTLFGDRDMSTAQAHLEELIRRSGVDYQYCEYTYNTRRAQALAKWAEQQPEGQRIHMALFRRYFVSGDNLADTEVLLDVVRSLGMDTEAAAAALSAGDYAAAVDNDWQKARSFEITGVPTTLAEGYILNGCQSEEGLQRFVSFLREQEHADALTDRPE